MKRIYFSFVYYLLTFQVLTVRCDSCRGERSQQGFALFYKNYSLSFTKFYSDCLNMCLDDPSCMSLNFWMDTKQCDLNTASRETCPTCYMKAPSRYMGMARYSGKMSKALQFIIKCIFKHQKVWYLFCFSTFSKVQFNNHD